MFEKIGKLTDEVIDLMTPGLLVIIGLILAFSVYCAVDQAINPPSHEGECVVFVWDDVAIYDDCPYSP